MFLGAAVLMSLLLVTSAAQGRPNIVILFADDLGYGDLGCFGNTTLRTPHIDSLARDGVKLTHHLAAASVCTPSRAAFLTGRYPIRSGMVATNLLRVNLWAASRSGLPENETTFAELAKTVGYKTALLGKWHLGLSKEKFGDFRLHPTNQGFDYFYGFPTTNMKDFGPDPRERVIASMLPFYIERLVTINLVALLSVLCLYRNGYIGVLVTGLLLLTPAVLTTGFYLLFDNFTLLNSMLFRQKELVEQPIDISLLTSKLVMEGREYIAERAKDGLPFLLFMSWSHTHTYLATSSRFKGRSAHGPYGDAVEELDWGVGEILQALKDQGLGDNTLVYFTSDQGGHLEESDVNGVPLGGFNGIFKGGKGHGAPDGGIRVPTALRWPGHVKAGLVSDTPTSMMDMYPMLAKAMGAELPSDRMIDGKDITDVLQGSQESSPHEFLFHYCGNVVHAVRYMPRNSKQVWKVELYSPPYLPGQTRCAFMCQCAMASPLDPPLLYDMNSDPGETSPIDVRDHPEVFEPVMAALEAHRASIESVPNQFSLGNLLWRPSLQPCCNGTFPFCKCQDAKFAGKFE